MNTPESKPMSRELRAVLHIVTSDAELKRKVVPHINIQNESIDWDAIFENDFGGGHMAAVVFSKAIWCDAITTKSDPFDRAFAMDLPLRKTVIEALAIRWSLTT
jgi:hypothetical protein